jgi:hypothetical protein
MAVINETCLSDWAGVVSQRMSQAGRAAPPEECRLPGAGGFPASSHFPRGAHSPVGPMVQEWVVNCAALAVRSVVLRVGQLAHYIDKRSAAFALGCISASVEDTVVSYG